MAIDAGAIRYEVETDTSSQTQAEKVIDKTTRAIEKDFERVDKASKKTNAQLSKTSKAVKQSTSAFKIQKGAIQQAGFQVQDFAVQIAGGQNALVAFGQQGSQLAGILGPGGAVIGAIIAVGSAIGSVLFKTLTTAGDAAENLTSTMETLNSVIVKSNAGVNALSNEYAELAKNNAAAAQAQLTVATIQANEALKNSQEVIKDGSSILQGWTTNLDDAGDALDHLRESGKSLEGQVVELDKAANANFGTWGDLKTAVDLAGSEFGATSTQAFKLVSALIDIQRSGSVENFNALDTVMSDIASTTGFSNEAFNEFTKTMVNATKEGRLSAEALELIGRLTRGADVSTQGTTNSIDSMIESLQAQAAAIGETTRQTALRMAMDKNATKAQIESIKAAFDVIERSEGVDFAIGVVKKGLSPIEQLEHEQEQLLALKARFVEDSGVFDNALTQNALDQAKIRQDALISSSQLILSSTGGMFSNLAGLLKSSGKEQGNAYKAMFALSKGFAVAQAALNLSIAISNASAVAPFPASLPAIAQVVSSGAALASSIAGATMSGGREFGGSTNAGSNYRINERGTPEIYSQGGNDFLMNSGGGKVTPMEKFEGGGFSGNVIINNNSGTPMEATVSMSERNIIVDMAVKRSEANLTNQVATGQGGFTRAMKQSTNTTFRAGR